MKTLYISIAIFLSAITTLSAQPINEQIEQLYEELDVIEKERQTIEGAIEDLKLQRVRINLDEVGLPKGAAEVEIICHRALCLAYDENYEQARWVAHVITPDIIKGREVRSNDFRVDSMVTTGTAVEEDYFLKYLQADSTYEYDGYGYDRGHLAPSADFRWSATALSESYFYSNMAPQLPEFNREKWAELEGALRGYIYRNPDAQLYVVTGPVFDENPPVVERSINKVAIPSFFWKVAIDLKNKRGIGFIMPHKNLTSYPLASFAVNIDQVEETIGLDFFPNIAEEDEKNMESQLEKSMWLPDVAAGDKEPLYAPDLPRNHFNTVQAQRLMNRGETVNVCGHVVGTRTSRKGNVLLNLDKQFPNQVFTVFIKKEFLVNFSYDPEMTLKGQTICAKGKVVNLGGTPAMFIEKEEELEIRK